MDTYPKALLFDLNGTMINDMDFHSRAWHHLLNNDLGGNFSMAEVKQNMYGKNQELLVRMFGSERFSQEEMDSISVKKEEKYQCEFLPHLTLLPGLHELLERAYQAGIPMAIGSAAIMFNIDFVLDNLNIRHYFKSIVSADDVILSKPHPETYLKNAYELKVNPADCLVFEDVPKGAEAARNAGMKCVILTTTHQQHEFAHMDNVLHFSADFRGDFFEGLLR
ncbi:HAD family phosphatase [Mucilaginibacter mali]|uniref:HAD family phosphatase n=1 Tax=Mucilaginibacter mali TaxID=2740462 RepID=A0A7D4PWE4_9SPHI|nr:HAD family phosphatase [Mucilaginibacter mali]QKJ31683.1 HAD family phosphatase [Mucilaginibacter mali]